VEHAVADLLEFLMAFDVGAKLLGGVRYRVGDMFEYFPDARRVPPMRVSPSRCSSFALAHFVVPLSVRAMLSFGRQTEVVTTS
jgi:hypothetical protein